MSQNTAYRLGPHDKGLDLQPWLPTVATARVTNRTMAAREGQTSWPRKGRICHGLASANRFTASPLERQCTYAWRKVE
jgi:hypothetical protein